jgi:cephalosporin-C deacetylase-like acetyl esterase
MNVAAVCILILAVCAPLGAQPDSQMTVGGDYAVQLEKWLGAEAGKQWRRRDIEVASLTSAAAIRARQERAIAALTEMLGGLPQEKTPLNARVTGRFSRDGYRVENVIFDSIPGFRVTANLYIPTSGGTPCPAVLGVAGHSVNGKASATYQHAFIALAKRGYVVLAFDPPGQGERLEYFDPDTGRSKVGAGTSEHMMAGLQCLLTGQNFARYEIWDGIRAFDYLVSRPEVDPKRIAVAGNSGGGTQAAYLAVFEPRLAAVVASCYITRWRELWHGPGPQDSEQVFAGFVAKGLDFSDFLTARAPRPFLMTTAIQDYFPINGARATYKESQRLFDLLAAGDKAGYFEYNDTHGWSRPRREAAYRWLDKWLLDKETSGEEPEIRPEEESLLYATATGQLATSGGSDTVQWLNAKEARKLAAARGPVTADAIRRALGLQDSGAAPSAAVVGSLEQNGMSIEKIEFTVEGGVKIPALLYRAASFSGRSPGVVYVSSFGKSSDPDLRDLVRAGRVVLALDPRGMGESYLPYSRTGYTQHYRIAARAWLLGRNLAEMQTSDLLSAHRYLKSRDEVDPARVSMIAKGAAAVPALFAAALEPGISSLLLERAIVSYTDVVEARIHENLHPIIVPGILKHLDLPAVLALLNGRRVDFITPVHPSGAPMLVSEARRKLGPAASRVRLAARGEGWTLARIAPDWLR